MKKKILMVNGFHDRYTYIPMGTFGLCDFLAHKGIGSKIFNAAMYGRQEYRARLRRTIDEYKPDHIGLILHWKELLENCIALSGEIKNSFPDITIVAGGITAGALGKELLQRCKAIDCVIQGDPEMPLYMLIAGRDPGNIPNVIYRQNNRIVSADTSYAIDTKTLNSVSYSKLSYLIDHDKYIEKIDGSVGFPVFIGRGCVYDCLHCGGSRKAFREHSKRRSIIYRDIPAVIADLRRLRRYTDTIYICYEVDPAYIRRLFAAISGEKTIAGKFRLNYGTWHLMDRALIDLYAAAFKFDAIRRSIIEISPDTTIDKDRRIIKDKALCYTNRQMSRSIEMIRKKLGAMVRIMIYYSRYHITQNSRKKLMRELENIHRSRERIYTRGAFDIEISTMALSTDVCSGYWDLTFANDARRDRVDVLLRAIRSLQYPHPGSVTTGNLCLYAPAQLSPRAILKNEIVIIYIDLLLREVSAFYFNITRALGFPRFVALLEGISDTCHDIEQRNAANVLDLLHGRLKRKYTGVYGKNPVFFRELFAMSVKYARARHAQVNTARQGSMDRPRLDQAKFYVSSYDFLDKQFHASLGNGVNKIEKDKTLYIFCGNRIFRFDHSYYPLFRLFDGKNTMNEILDKIATYDYEDKDTLLSVVPFIRSYRHWFTSSR